MPGRGPSEGHSYPKGRRTRAEIVRAALEAFSAGGYRNASMVQIAAQCGVSRAGLAHHFPTKEALLAAVLQERDRADVEMFLDGADPSADGLDYLRRMLRVIEHNASTPGVVGLFATLSIEAADPNHPAHAYFAARYASLRRDLRLAFADLAARGMIRAGVDLTDLESDLIALIDGLQIQWLLDPPGVDMAARLRRRLTEILGTI